MKRQSFLIVLLFLLITLVFFYPIFRGEIPFPGDLLVSFAPYNSSSYLGYAPGGVPNKAQGSDVIKEAFPWKFFVIEAIKKGELPFWNPYNFSGNQILANFQSAVFSPFNLILLVFPFSFAWVWFIFVAPFLAAYFNYLFLRELKLSKIASIFGGIVFAFSSYMVVWMEYGNITQTLLWLPLALLFTEKLIKQFSRRNLFFLMLTLLASLAGGYIQGYFYLLIVVMLYLIIKSSSIHSFSIKRLLIFLVLLICPFLLFASQLFTTLMLFANSSRGAYSLEQIQYLLNPWWYAITVIVPDFFGNPASRNFWFNGTYIERVSYFGVIPFMLAIAALLSYRKNKEITFFSILFIVVFLISLDLNFTKYIFTLPIPMLSTTVPTRILGIFEFCGSILAAFGLEFFLQKKEKKNFLIAFSFVSVVIFLSFLFTLLAPKIFSHSEWTTHLAITKRNLILPSIFIFSFFILFLIRFSKSKIFVNYVLATVIILLVSFDLFYFFHKITPFSPKEFVYPQTNVITYLQNHAGIDRFWGYGSGYIDSNFQTYDKTFSPEGEDPLHIKSYTEFLAASQNGTLPNTLPRPDANIAAGYGEKDLDNNYYRQKVLNIDGIKYVLNKDDGLGKEYRANTTTFNEEKYKLVWQQAPWQIYENLHVAKRTFLTNDYLVKIEKDKVISAFFQKTFDEKKTIILNEKLPVDVSKFTNGSVKVLSYEPNTVMLQTTSDAPALLFLSDTYYSSWKASIDGKETKLYLADYTFRAVVVPQGKHTVRFYYDPIMFKRGLLLSGITVGFLILVFIKLKNVKI